MMRIMHLSLGFLAVMPEELYNKLSFNHPTNIIISSSLYNFHHTNLMSLNELDLKLLRMHL